MQPTALVKVVVPRSPLPLLTEKDVGPVKFKLLVVNTCCVSVWSPFAHNILLLQKLFRRLEGY